MFVYLITNAFTGMQYVGTTTTSVRARMREHLSQAQRCTKHSPLYAMMRIFPAAAFQQDVLAECDSYDAMLEREREEIATRQTMWPQGYNLVKGGRGNYGWRMRAETRERISAKAMGRVAHNRGVSPDAETRLRMSVAQRQRHVREEANGTRTFTTAGRKHSEATRRQMSTAHKGRPWSEARRAAHTPWRHSSETIQRIRDIKHGVSRPVHNAALWEEGRAGRFEE